ncbi:MAG TPA: hypothetical protein VMZ50_10655 [Phycisphaerae bacterium]|nr:hypothetical protein [Phycisphaerae bacterium]
MGFRAALRFGLLSPLLLVGVTRAEDKLPVWELASRTYESAMSQYNSALYNQAGALFEEFIKKYGTHEAVPVAYLQLAHCKAQEKKFEEWQDAIDTLIRRFPGDPAWFLANGSKLERLRSQKQNDTYLEELEKFARRAKQLPFDLIHYVYLRPEWSWYQVYRPRERIPYHLRWLVDVMSEPGWERGIVEMADTPERAQKALQILSATLRKLSEELPADWQFAHVLLLEKAGKEQEARKQFQTYADGWGDDPRGMGLWILWAEHLQEIGDDPAADAAYDHVLKTYMGYASLSALLGPRLDYLHKKNRYHDYVALAKRYLETYPRGTLRDRAVQYWLQLLRTPAVNGDAEALSETMEVLEKYRGKDSSSAIRWLVDLNIDRKKPAEAVQLARAFLEDKRWSHGTYWFLRNYAAGRCKEFAPLLKEAEEKYKIFAPNPEGEAAKLLKALQGRMKDEQERHMEEVAQEILSKHRDTHEAVEAVKLMADYYFRKVLPAPRDQWMNRMIQTYPRHPETERILITQVQALRAGKRYDDMAAALDLVKERFPAAGLPFSWFYYREECYQAAKDRRGGLDLARKYFRSSAEQGNLHALQELFRRELPYGDEEITTEQFGDFWMQWAKEFKGTRAELYCLREAVESYYTRPHLHRHLKREILTDVALAIVKQLQEQQIDPEVRWNAEFMDVNILAEQKQPKRAGELLEQRIANRKKVRDLGTRLKFSALGQAFGEDAKVARQGLALAKRLSRVCFTSQDLSGIEYLQAQVYFLNQAYAKAEGHYLSAVRLSPWPIRAYGSFRGALESARRISPARMLATADRYIAQINQCQGIVPRILLDVGVHGLGSQHPAFAAVRKRLSRQYPASDSRGQLEKRLADWLAQQKKK